MKLTRHNLPDPLLGKELHLHWLVNVGRGARAVTALVKLLVSPGVQIATRFTAWFGRGRRSYCHRVSLSAGNRCHVQLVLSEKEKFHGFVLLASTPNFFALPSLASQSTTPCIDAPLTSQSHRVEERTGNAHYLERPEQFDRCKFILNVQDGFALDAQLLVLIGACHENATF